MSDADITAFPPLSTGLELILNACESCLQIVITNDEKPLCFQEWYLPQKSSEILTPALEEICVRLNIKPNSFRRIGCFVGPGSFTGIRLVLATAAALRRASKAQLASLNYMQALATTAIINMGLLYPATVFVVTHARRNLVHFQKFCSYGPQIPAVPLTEVELTTPLHAFELAGETKATICGSGLARNAEIFQFPLPEPAVITINALTILPQVTTPSLKSLTLLARHGDYFPKDLAPKYVRSCDALDNLSPEDMAQANDIINKNPQTGL